MSTLTVSNDLDFTNYLGSTASEKVAALPGEIFFAHLRTAYTPLIVRTAVDAIFSARNTPYKGMEAFKERILASFLDGNSLSGPDQVYLNNYCLRLFSLQSK